MPRGGKARVCMVLVVAATWCVFQGVVLCMSGITEQVDCGQRGAGAEAEGGLIERAVAIPVCGVGHVAGETGVVRRDWKGGHDGKQLTLRASACEHRVPPWGGLQTERSCVATVGAPQRAEQECAQHADEIACGRRMQIA